MKVECINDALFSRIKNEDILNVVDESETKYLLELGTGERLWYLKECFKEVPDQSNVGDDNKTAATKVAEEISEMQSKYRELRHMKPAGGELRLKRLQAINMWLIMNEPGKVMQMVFSDEQLKERYPERYSNLVKFRVHSVLWLKFCKEHEKARRGE